MAQRSIYDRPKRSVCIHLVFVRHRLPMDLCTAFLKWEQFWTMEFQTNHVFITVSEKSQLQELNSKKPQLLLPSAESMAFADQITRLLTLTSVVGTDVEHVIITLLVIEQLVIVYYQALLMFSSIGLVCHPFVEVQRSPIWPAPDGFNIVVHCSNPGITEPATMVVLLWRRNDTHSEIQNGKHFVFHPHHITLFLWYIPIGQEREDEVELVLCVNCGEVSTMPLAFSLGLVPVIFPDKTVPEAFPCRWVALRIVHIWKQSSGFPRCFLKGWLQNGAFHRMKERRKQTELFCSFGSFFGVSMQQWLSTKTLNTKWKHSTVLTMLAWNCTHHGIRCRCCPYLWRKRTKNVMGKDRWKIFCHLWQKELEMDNNPQPQNFVGWRCFVLEITLSASSWHHFKFSEWEISVTVPDHCRRSTWTCSGRCSPLVRNSHECERWCSDLHWWSTDDRISRHRSTV